MSIASAVAFLVVPALLATSGELELGVRRIEVSLLHRTLDLGGVRQWDARAKRWMAQPPPPARVLVLHLWAVECPPCVKEMPLLRDITRAFERTERDVRFAYVSETLDEEQLLGFIRNQRANMPETPLYQSSDTRIRKTLQITNQPVTLLLDEHMVVRQAFVGSLAERRNELVESIERLLQTMKRKPSASR